MTRLSPRAEWKSISVRSAAIRVLSLHISLSTTAPTPERNRSRVPSARTRPATNPTWPNTSGYTRGRSASRVRTAPSNPTGKTDSRHMNALTCKALGVGSGLVVLWSLAWFFFICFIVLWCLQLYTHIHTSYYITHTYAYIHTHTWEVIQLEQCGGWLSTHTHSLFLNDTHTQ